jgi:hypothetical protein
VRIQFPEGFNREDDVVKFMASCGYNAVRLTKGYAAIFESTNQDNIRKSLGLLFHVTTKQNSLEILRNGFAVHDRNDDSGFSYNGRTYFFKGKDITYDIWNVILSIIEDKNFDDGTSLTEDDYVAIIVDTQNIPDNVRFFTDSMTPDAVYTTDYIPSSAIVTTMEIEEPEIDEQKNMTQIQRIQNTVNESISKVLCEGSWGYEPTQSDSFGDQDWTLLEDMSELVYDRCISMLRKYGKNAVTKGGEYWDIIGIIEHFFEGLPDIDETFGDDKGQERYYVWWNLITKKKKNIIKLYKDAVTYCANSKEWQDAWDKPDKIKKSAEKRLKTVAKYEKLLKDKIKQLETDPGYSTPEDLKILKKAANDF